MILEVSSAIDDIAGESFWICDVAARFERKLASDETDRNFVLYLPVPIGAIEGKNPSELVKREIMRHVHIAL